MLRSKTTLVLGAGASNEVNMPLGAKLKTLIAELIKIEPDGRSGRIAHTDENREMFDEIERHDRFKADKPSLLAAAQQISAGVAFASSIDNFLEIRRDNPDIAVLAKAALVHLILKGERNSNLIAERPSGSFALKPTAIDGTWYQEFAQLFFEKVGVNDIENTLGHLSVVDFNYDRCFEQVMFHAFRGLYNLPRARAVELMAKLTICHPYGAVGTLHNARDGIPASEFGGDPTGRYLHLSEGIRTFTEQMTDATVRYNVGEAIESARTIIFLGCAYHPQNIEIINGAARPSRKTQPRTVFGTTYLMSDADRKNIEAKLTAVFRAVDDLTPRIVLVDAKSGDFLRQYKRTLSAD